jgi:hypothetical protein
MVEDPDAGTSQSSLCILYLRQNLFDCSRISLIEGALSLRSINVLNGVL